MKASIFSLFGVCAFAFVLTSQAVLGDESSGAPVEVPTEATDAPSPSPTFKEAVLVDESSGAPVEAPAILEEMSDSPVEVPTEATDAPSPSPTFKEGDAPVVFQPGDIKQPVFESPVAPPPISEAGRIDGTWMVTSAAMVLAAAL